MSFRAAATLAVFLLCCVTPKGLRAQSSAGQLDGNPALFSVLAAINSAGYDAEANSPNNHPLRAAVRKWVAARNPACLPELRRFFAAHRRESPESELSQYVAWALSVEGPPAFKPRFAPNQMPPGAVALEGFSDLLARFYDEAALAEAWKQAQPAYEAAVAGYHEPVTQAVFEANAYLRNPTSGSRGRRFQVYLELLAAPHFVQSLSLGDDYFVVVTPSPAPRIFDVRHAYLHYLLDPLALRNSAGLDKKKALAEFAQASPVLADAFREDFTLLAGMSLVKAVEARLDRGRRQALVDQAMAEGFILTAAFNDGLAGYEKQDQALRLYLPHMIEEIDLAKEDKRIAQVQFVSKRAVRTVRVEQPAAPEPSGPAKAAEAAEKLYQQRDLPAAKSAFRQVIEASAPKPLQARAYFGLARIAVLEKQPELAQQLFERTLELDPDSYERAWAHVYLARLARAAQEPDAAVKHYQAALAVEGATEGARKAAQAEVSAVSAKPSPDKP